MYYCLSQELNLYGLAWSKIILYSEHSACLLDVLWWLQQYHTDRWSSKGGDILLYLSLSAEEENQSSCPNEDYGINNYKNPNNYLCCFCIFLLAFIITRKIYSCIVWYVSSGPWFTLRNPGRKKLVEVPSDSRVEVTERKKENQRQEDR